METNILLENGTNEVEILEFTLDDNHYGINVAKIREILTYQPVTPVPNSHYCVEGIFMPRDTMITVISLRESLGLKPADIDGLFIITNFNKLNIAFHVDRVIGIHRISWADINTPDSTINAENNGVSTGVVKFDDKLVVILDFEKIVTDISPDTGLRVTDVEAFEGRDRGECPIIIAEDSPMLGRMITDCLKKSGYKKLKLCENGQVAWDQLNEWKDAGNLYKNAKCIITDIEMPVMDGHRLTKLCKEDDEIKLIPLVIFSSLVNDEMRRKGEALGADAQLTKPEIGQLVSAIDKLIDNSKAPE
ncbi:MAG: chemotaxis protein CheV [Lachnospiraceae bacterium]|nr:chemotaxis protein CheV [Lachnospiraceae bacterium]